MTVDELRSSSRWSSRATSSSTLSSTSNSLDMAVTEETATELNKGWLDGPWLLEDLLTKFGHVTVSKRFGLEQTNKTRVIDDYSASSVNSAFGHHNRLSLGGLDEIQATAATLVRLAKAGGCGTVKSIEGEAVEFTVHPAWPRLLHSGALRLVGRTLDL
eukprot:6481624-Amphidinium_carterae.1